MANLERAIAIAVAAHAGQLDKEGAPYITHPLRLMEAVKGEPAKTVAVLHDVVEDTSVTLDDLRREGFSAEVLDALAVVTHRKDEPYADYVVRAKANPIARQVKLADVADNCRLERCILRPARIERDLARVHRYLLSYKFLTDQIDEQQYRTLMDSYGHE